MRITLSFMKNFINWIENLIRLYCIDLYEKNLLGTPLPPWNKKRHLNFQLTVIIQGNLLSKLLSTLVTPERLLLFMNLQMKAVNSFDVFSANVANRSGFVNA